MGKLVNELSWSSSRGKTFRECARSYWFHYYGSWGGWETFAPERTRLLYLLKQMTNLDMWIGNLVHGVIEEACQMAKQGKPPPLEVVKQRVTHLLREGWKASKDGAWKEKPKGTVNLFEHYHDTFVPPTKTDAIKKKAMDCLTGFFNSKEWQVIQALPADWWLTMEELDSFPVNGTRAYAKPDLAIRINGRVKLYDWKSGKPRPEDDDQIIGYALFALHKGWAGSVKDIDLVLAYLAAGLWKTVPVDQQKLDTLTQKIKREIGEMKKPLVDPVNNIAEEKAFPVTDNVRACRRCFYRMACDGSKRPGAELNGSTGGK